MIIQNYSKNINSDIESVSTLAEQFELFKKHNFKVVRSVKHFIDIHNDDRMLNTPYGFKKVVTDNGVVYDSPMLVNDYFTVNKQVRLQKCNNWAEFAKFIDGDKELKQTKSNACGCHLLCPFCASRKASKIQKRLEDFFLCFDESIDLYDSSIFDDNMDISKIVNNEFEKKASEHTIEAYKDVLGKYGNITKKYDWYFTVLTVKNSFDINEVLTHLKNSFQKIRKRINHYKERKSDTVFSCLGGVYSIEITYNYKTGFHPHINFLWCSDRKINDCKIYKSRKQKKNNQTSIYWNSEKLSQEWKHITKDSFITSCTPLNIQKDLKKNLMEIIKYSLKFNDMPTNILVQIYPYLYKQRFFGSVGFMYGLGLDKIKIEEFKTERQFVEIVMTYKKGIYHFKDKNKIDIVIDDVESDHDVKIESTKKKKEVDTISLNVISKELEYKRDDLNHLDYVSKLHFTTKKNSS